MEYEPVIKEIKEFPKSQTPCWITHGETNPGETNPVYMGKRARKSLVIKFLKIYGEGLEGGLEMLRAPLKS